MGAFAEFKQQFLGEEEEKITFAKFKKDREAGVEPAVFKEEPKKIPISTLFPGFDIAPTKGTTQPFLEGKGLAGPLGAVKTIEEEIARSGASLTLTYQNIGRLITGKTTVDEIDISGTGWENKLGRAIFGDRPLESIEFRVAKGEIEAPILGEQIEKGEITIFGRKLPKALGTALKTQPKVVSPLAVGALIVLDFTGLGGEARAVRLLAKTTKTEEVAGILRKMKLSEELIPRFSGIIAKTTKVEEVKRILEEATAGIKEVKQKVLIKTPKTLDSIITEESKAPQQAEEGLGVTTIPKAGFEGEQQIRVSEHSPAFRAFFKENKRSPRSLADWKKIAETELKAGRSLIGLSDEFRAIKQGIKEPVEKEIDIESIFAETEEKVLAGVPEERAVRGALVTEAEKKEFLQSLKKELMEKIKRGRGLTPTEAGRIGKLYKDFIRGKTGLLKEGRFIRISERAPEVIREDVLLRQRLRLAERAAAKGFKAGAREARKETRATILDKLRETRQEIDSVKTDIIDYVKANLHPADRGKAINLIRNAKTQQNLAKAFARINNWAEQAEKKIVKNNILKIQKKALESPSVSIDHKERITQALDLFELKGHTKETIRKLSALRRYLEEAEKAGEDVELPMRLWQSLRILNRQPFKEIPLRTLEGVEAEITKLEDLGRRTWAVKQLRYQNERETWKADLLVDIHPIQSIEKIQPAIGERLTVSEKGRNFIIDRMNQANRIDKVISPMDVIFDIADGGRATYSGAHSLAKRRFDSKFSHFLDTKDRLSNSVIELAEKLKLNPTNFDRIGIYAARQQGAEVSRLGYSRAEIEALKLTPAEDQLYNLMRKSMDDQFPFIENIMKEVYNQPVKKVKNYFSFMTDWKAMDEIEVFQRMGPNVEEYGRPTKTVEMGFVKSRLPGAKQRLKVNAMEVYLKHMENVAYMRTLGKDIKMFYEIVNSPEYSEKAGDILQMLMLEWADVMARKGGAAGAQQIMVLDLLRKHIGAGVLGLKLSSALIQPTSLIDGMGMIGFEWALRGSKNFAQRKQWREFLMKFPELRERSGGETAIQELIEGNWVQRIQAKGFVPLQELDRMTANSIAAGAYERKMTELGLPIDLIAEPNPEALQYAQLVVRRTQASALFKDVPLTISKGAVFKNRSIDRAFFQFQNFLLFRWSRIRHDAIRAGITTGDPRQAANVIFWITLASLAATGIRMGTWRLIDAITGKDRDEDDQSKFLLRNLISEFTGMIPFVGNLLGSYMYDSAFMPMLQAPEAAVQGFKKTIEGKYPETKAKGLTQFLSNLGAIAGIPGAFQAGQLIRQAIPEAERKRAVPTPPLKLFEEGPELIPTGGRERLF